jgi:hypothetical protein
MTLTQWAGLFGAVVVIAIVARLLRLSESRLSTTAAARAHAERLLAGFVSGRALVSEDASCALVAGNGTIAVLVRDGPQVRAGRLVPPLRLGEAVEGVAVRTGAGLFGSVTLRGVIVEDIRALEASVPPLAVH